jgi:hypothetical protein
MRALPALVAALLLLVPLAAGAGTPAPAATPTQSDDVRADAGPASTVQTEVPVDARSGTNGSRTVAAANGTRVNESTANETPPHVLTIPDADVRRVRLEPQRIDLGPAVGFGANETALHLETLATVERIESRSSAAARQRRIVEELGNLEQRVISLRSAEAAAIRAYAAGGVESRVFLTRLARIDMTARALDERRERLATLTEETEDFTIDQARFATLERELDTLTGPVRRQMVDVLAGASSPRWFYVAAGTDAVTITTIDRGRWIREVYRADLRDRGGGSMGPQDALNATRDAYPVIWATKDQGQAQVRGTGPSYLVRIPHSRGRLSAFVDSGSQRVFKEFQTRPLSTMQHGQNVSNTGDGLRIVVSRTYPGAPMRVNLTDAETGEPIDYNVTVGPPNGERELVGRTGVDGVLWTLSPRGPFTVAAIAPEENSFVTRDVTPAEPPRVYGAEDRNATVGAVAERPS